MSGPPEGHNAGLDRANVAGFWVGGGLGAGIGVAAGGLVPLWIERATRRQEAVESALGAEML